jgi:hypothetical protein
MTITPLLRRAIGQMTIRRQSREGEKEHMVKSLRSAWFGIFQQVERRQIGAEHYPTHAHVVLPDGQLMYLRTASLAAAKDLLAAQRAVERRMQANHAAPHGLRTAPDLRDLRGFAAEPSR